MARPGLLQFSHQRPTPVLHRNLIKLQLLRDCGSSSRRNIVHRLTGMLLEGARREVLGMLRVRDIMTKEVFTLEAKASALEAAWALTRRAINCAPVRDAGGNIIGMLSKSDLVNPEPQEWIKGEALVEDLMTPNVLGLYEDDLAAAAARGLAESNVHQSVVYNDEGKLVGIVAAMDIVKAVARGEDLRSTE
jgi:predicted transcriptional regulator